MCVCACVYVYVCVCVYVQLQQFSTYWLCVRNIVASFQTLSPLLWLGQSATSSSRDHWQTFCWYSCSVLVFRIIAGTSSFKANCTIIIIISLLDRDIKQAIPITWYFCLLLLSCKLIFLCFFPGTTVSMETSENCAVFKDHEQWTIAPM